MSLIYLLFTLLVLWFCIAGITLAVRRYIGEFAIARAAGIVAVVLAFFFVEHFIGLGKLFWLLPVTLAFSAWMFWKEQETVKGKPFWISELVFALAFLYGFAWRFAFPSISPSSEQITDLFFISNYLPGHTLPPLDNWNPPHSFDYYYAFQHYAAALMGRVLNLDAGTSYALGFATITALTVSLIWFVASHFISRISLRVLLVATLVFGGTGFSPVLHLAYKDPDIPKASEQNQNRYHSALEAKARDNIINSVRYIGGSRDNSRSSDRDVRTGVANILLPETGLVSSNKYRMVLPAENFGYQYFVSDYHPTLGGFFLLLLALALIVCVEQDKMKNVSQALLAACVPIMMITNTWTFPLLVLLIGGWLAFRWFYGKSIAWVWLIGGGVAVTLLIYPFLIGFAGRSLSTPVRFVPWEEHTPLSRFIALQWPVLLVLAFGFFEPKYRKLSLALSSVWLGLLMLSEVIFIDDPTGAQYQRTNTTMKWWGWIQVGVFASVGSLCLGSSKKWIRWATVAVFILVNAVALDLARYWLYSGKYYAGKLSGHHWYTHNATNRQMFEYLREAPRGIILENMLGNAYTNSSIYGVFNEKPVLLGWPSHLMTWHGNVPRVWILNEEIQRFYRGEMQDPIPWLLSQDIQYIIFRPEDDDKKFDTINNQIKSHYAWHEFNHARNRHTGIWVRLNETGSGELR